MALAGTGVSDIDFTGFRTQNWRLTGGDDAVLRVQLYELMHQSTFLRDA